MSVIYSRGDAASVVDGDTVYEPDESGAFNVPHEFAAVLLNVHVAGEKQWETDDERNTRLGVEELERRRDPANLLAEVEKLGGFTKGEPVDPLEGLNSAGLKAVAKAALAKAKELDAIDAAEKKAAAADAKKAADAEKKAAADKAAAAK